MATVCVTPPPADPWHYAILGMPIGAPLVECVAAYDRLAAANDPRLAPSEEQRAAIDLQNALDEAIDAITLAHSGVRP